MSSQGNIPLFTRQSRVRDVTYGLTKIRDRITLDNYGTESEARDLNFADQITFGENAKFRAQDCLSEFLLHLSLIYVQIGEKESGVAKSNKAENQEQPSRAPEDSRLP
jgi:hypothetical protein